MEYLTTLDYNPEKQSMILAGSTQEGKTTHAISYCKMLTIKGFNILILDKNRKFTKLDPDKVIHTLSEVTGKGLQILQPHRFTSPEQMHQFFEDVAWVAYSYHYLIFVIDELHSWFRDKRTHIPSFELLCRECHNQNSSFMAIFQSPSEVPNYVMRNSHHRFVLYLDLDQDVDAMKKVIGKEMKLFAESKITKYEGLYKEKGKPVKLFKVVKSD
ncbi:MAG: hypothetical protein IIC67_06900 [Thaumarchaeota archaeon]|nr:hypothetical protein [Nitrososphaerota archaeon]